MSLSLGDFSKLVTAKLPENATWFSSCYGCVNLESINIPNGITSLTGQGLTNCRKLVLTEIPASVKTIGGNNIYETFNIAATATKKIKVLSEDVVSLTHIASFATANSQGIYIPSVDVYVPDSAFDDYKVADNWSTIFEAGKLHKLSEWTN